MLTYGCPKCAHRVPAGSVCGRCGEPGLVDLSGDTELGELTPFVPPLPHYPAAGRERVHGRVVAQGMLRAPLSGRRCVAYRVWGTIGELTLEDAVALPFGMVLPGGRRLRLKAQAPALRVAFSLGDGQLRERSVWIHRWAPPLFGRAFRSGRLPDRLEAFLRERGLRDERAAGTLHELIMEPGTGALVEGKLREPRRGGYRDALPVLTLGESDDDAPVVIRSRDAPPGT